MFHNKNMIYDKNIAFLIWKDNENDIYIIGELEKKKHSFYFKYRLEELSKALSKGFTLLEEFPSYNHTYKKPYLFVSFANRLPPPTRPDIEKILKTYDMKEYDEFELLRRSGAKLPTDRLEFFYIPKIAKSGMVRKEE